MKVGILTGGGDCPGLNAVIRAVTLSAHSRGWEVLGIRYGYRGLVEDEPDGVVTLAGLGAVQRGRATLTLTLADAAGNKRKLTRALRLPGLHGR